NIMILESGQPKIMDFGIAKIESSQLTAAGQFFGTPLYMSPEQALGQSLDARSDLFSLGALAYGLLTGQNAFGAAGVPRIITRVIHEDPAPPTTIVPGLPADIDYFIARAIAKKPDDRYPSGQAMAEDAADILADTSPRHRPDGTTPQAADGTLMSLGSEHLQEEPASQAANSLPIVAVPEPARPRPRSARGATAARAPQPLPRKRAISSGVLGLALVVVVIASLAAITVGWLVLRARATQQAPSSVAPATSARPADAAAPVASDKARLIIDCEHSLKYGKLRVWVDDALIVEETLSGRVAKKVIAFEIRKGTFAQALDLSPGTHEVKVQFAWDDNIKTEHIAGYFSSGTSRRLSIKLGAGMRGLVKKDLKVDWE
ncbi:MAG: serine/threonine protein kinase, partial [Vicinamibacteria bacterium]|nr:serine/threonine protein kinase [Vicinamibacteria bacterium]